MKQLSPHSLTELELCMMGSVAAPGSSGYHAERHAVDALETLPGNLSCLTNLRNLTLDVNTGRDDVDAQQQLHVGGWIMRPLAVLTPALQAAST